MKVYGFDLLPWPHLDAPSYYPDSNALFDPARGMAVYAEHLDQMVMFEELGFDAICMNEHHAKPYGLMPSPNLIAAALTQRTRRIKIGILGNLPALHGHPVRLAEEIAMLDCMSGGRIISGFVRGVPQEYLALSTPLPMRGQRLGEAWDLVIKAWTTREPFDWHGKYFSYDRVSIWPRPLQQPHPPIVLPADSDEGIETAARRRVPRASPIDRSRGRKGIFERYRAARGTPRLDADARALPRAAPRLRGRDERAGAGGSGAASRLLLAEAPELPPRLDEAARPVAAGAAAHRPVRGGAAALRVRLRPDAEGGADVRRRPRLRRPARFAPTCRSWAPACSWGCSSSAACRTPSHEEHRAVRRRPSCPRCVATSAQGSTRRCRPSRGPRCRR